MKLQLKTDGLTGDNLIFVEQLNRKFAEMPDAATKEDMQAEINAMFKDHFGKDGKLMLVTKEEFEELKKQLTDEAEGTIKGILKEQGTQLKALLEKGGAEEKDSILKMLEEHQADFKENLSKKTGTVEIQLKVAAVTTIGDAIVNSISDATAQRLGDGTVYDIRRGTPFVLDFVNVGQTNQPYLIWWDELSKEGDFAVVAEGALKPLLEYIFERKSADYRKAAGYTVLTDEFMMDFPKLVTTIKRLMEIDLMNEINDILLADIIAAVPGFTYTALNDQITDPDNYAAIGAAIAQIQALFFTPNVLVLNPRDIWTLKLEKDLQGRYQMPPFQFNGATYEFGRVIVDPRVTPGYFLVGDGRMFNVDMRGGVIIRIGYNGDDLIRNQQTVVVEQYFFDYISTNRKGAFVYGNFSTIKELLNNTASSL